MTNKQQNTREAAIEQAWFKHWDGQSVTKSGAWFELFTAGFLAGAASVDRVEIVPLDVILFCPECKAQHIDKAEPDVCEKCGHGKGDHFDPDNELGLNEDGCAECESAGAFEPCQGFVAWLNPPHKKAPMPRM